ncbi:hypothetical protein GEMRC1_002446 [Eukaryota sp. GEM-RC1]
MAKHLTRGNEARLEWGKSKTKALEEKKRSMAEQEQESMFKPKITAKSARMVQIKSKNQSVIDRLTKKKVDQLDSSVQEKDKTKAASDKVKAKELAKRADSTSSRLYNLGKARVKQRNGSSVTTDTVNESNSKKEKAKIQYFDVEDILQHHRINSPPKDLTKDTLTLQLDSGSISPYRSLLDGIVKEKEEREYVIELDDEEFEELEMMTCFSEISR